jgi:release factor glutamine methyltransferase
MTWQEAEAQLITTLRNIYPEEEAVAVTDWVIEHLSLLKRSDRLLKNKTTLNYEQQEKLNELERRLLKNEPVQYVLNESWFCGLKFYVDSHVLIPRPETEELVEWVISDCKFPVSSLHILDIGSGSGCIPVSLKRRLRKADVWGCDVSSGALAVAKQNAAALSTDIKFLKIDFLNESQWQQLPAFDIIISNPPYIAEQDKLTMHENVLSFEPHTALFVPDSNPLLFYKAIARFGKTHLKPEGSMYLEIHESLGDAVMSLYNESGYETELRKDMQGKERMVKVWDSITEQEVCPKLT